jgi:hypothetical protein
MPNYSRFSKEDIDNIRNMAAEGMSTSEIAVIYNKTAKAIQKAYVRYGIKGLPSGGQFGERNSFWNGGVTIDKNGYILQRCTGHPFSNTAGYVRQHRLVMENHLKRFLLPTEVVHHIDGNKQNNKIENLELFSSNAEHLKIELSGKCPNWSPQGIEKLRKSRAKAVLVRKQKSNRN